MHLFVVHIRTCKLHFLVLFSCVSLYVVILNCMLYFLVCYNTLYLVVLRLYSVVDNNMRMSMLKHV